MQYLQRFTKQEVIQLQRNWVFSHYVEKRSHPSRIQGCISYPPTQMEKGILKSVTIISILLYVSCWEILARVLPNWSNEHLEQSVLQPENHCGFRKDRWRIDMIFTTRQLQEKCHELNEDLYMTFIWPYQSIWHSQSWWTLENYGKVWLSGQVHSSGAAVLRWYACTGPK